VLRIIAILLISVSLVQGVWAQFFFIGPGFLPDENGTNLDNPKGRKVDSNTVSGPMIKDCTECPEMVVIPAGSFMMGSSIGFSSSDERPQRRVEVKSFALGKYEVTQEQWQILMGLNPSQNVGPKIPVENVSREDIQRYVGILNQKTGKKYRLPSEAEWEYAARAGTTTEWSFGNDSSKLGEYAWYEFNAKNSSDVGQKLPNGFGLYDMHGNVWELVEDCWHDDYSSRGFFSQAPTDGSAWTSACSTTEPVLRGGAWYGSPTSLRSAYRGKRAKSYGFRLALSL